MLACARIGAVHSVVFGGFAAHELATRIDDARPRVILSASCGIEVNRIIPYKPLARRGDRRSAREARSLRRSCSGRCAGPSSCRAATMTGSELEAAARPGRLRAGRWRPIRSTSSTPRARPASRKASCATMAGTPSRLHWSMRNIYGVTAGRGVLDRLRCRLGGRPFLYRLRAAAATAAPRSCTRASRSARPMPAPSGGSSSSIEVRVFFTAPTAFRAIKREDPEGDLIRAHDLSAVPRAVPGRRARRSADRRLGRGAAEGAGHRPLVADRDRLADRRQLPRHRAAAGQARLVHARGAGLGRAGAGGRSRAARRAN